MHGDVKLRMTAETYPPRKAPTGLLTGSGAMALSNRRADELKC